MVAARTKTNEASRAPAARREWRIWKVARLATYVAAVSLGVGLVAARSVYGDVKSAALSMGHELGQLGDVGTQRPLRLNGQPIFVASATEDRTVDAVLDETEARCKVATAAGVAEPENLSRPLGAPLPQESSDGRAAGILREKRGDRGVVACLIRDDGAPAGGFADTASRLATVMRTGDLRALGRLRYVFAERTSTGRTHVVAAWTEGSFDLFALLPAAGADAPGSDSPNAPRPPSAQRILSADVEGMPYGVRIYDSSAPALDVVAAYDRDMAARGYTPAYGVPGEGPLQRAFTRPGADVLVITSPSQGRTLVSIIEISGR